MDALKVIKTVNEKLPDTNIIFSNIILRGEYDLDIKRQEFNLKMLQKSEEFNFKCLRVRFNIPLKTSRLSDKPMWRTSGFRNTNRRSMNNYQDRRYGSQEGNVFYQDQRYGPQKGNDFYQYQRNGPQEGNGFYQDRRYGPQKSR